MSDSPIVRTRIAPSPTGELHIGGLRTALYDYALAKKNGGQFILRLEDTDQKRYVPGSEKRLLQTLKAYGLTWDEGPDISGPYGPYVQTQRLEIYQKYINELISKGAAYYCFCSEDRLTQVRDLQKAQGKVPRYDRHCLHLSPAEIQKNLDANVPYVVRLRVPENEKIVFNDLIRGKIIFNTNDVDDQILIKSNGIPTYHFAAVVDDHLMNISHVFRGEEWLSSTPKHLLLYRYFGWQPPLFAHLTVLLDPTHKGKMSKRTGSTHAQSFLDEGYLPEAMLNFLMLLGWNPGTNQEIFTLDEFVQAFDISGLNKKAPIFDRHRLDYLNGLYLRQKSNSDLVQLVKPFIPSAPLSDLEVIIPLIKERITKLSDAASLTNFLYHDIDLDKATLLQNKFDPTLVKSMLSQTIDLLKSNSDFSQIAIIQPKLLDLIKQNSWKTGDYFMIFRLSLSGQKITPPIVDCLPLLGQKKTLARLQRAWQLLQ